jgi:predicted porin
MKKTLIAVAALVATGAFAQSVTIRGSFDTGLVQYNMKGAQVTGIGSNLSSTSALFFEGNSDLGGGLKTSFRFETDLNTASTAGNTGAASNVASAAGANAAAGSGIFNGAASVLGNGEVFLAVGGAAKGTLTLGTMNNVGLRAHLAANPFGTAIGSGFRATSTSAANAGSTAAVRNDNTFAYDTPNFGGFTGTWLARKAQTTASLLGNTNYSSSLGAQQQSAVSELALAYNAGPLNAILGRSTEDATVVNAITAGTGVAALGNKGTLTSLAANYNMGATTFYAGYQGQKSVSAAGVAQRDTTAFNIAAKYVMGVNTFMVNMGRLSGATNKDTIGTSTSASLVGLGYEYALAKNAALVARYERIADTAALGVAATTGYNVVAGNTDRTRMGVGLRYNF